MMELNPEELGAVANRLRRAEGQIGGILRMLEQGRNCTDIVTQLAAVNHALDKAGFALIATNLKQCLAEPGGAEPGGADSADAQSLEKLFLSLA
jgi:DNA-binding FrmR family transcriptional regulator